jgi:MSHA biogenesis protein MshG
LKQFEYQARRNGQTIVDRIRADNLQAARARLDSEGYDVVALTEASERSGISAAAADHRLPLEVVLESLAEDLGDRRMRSAVGMLQEKLAAGASLDEALNAVGQRVPRYLAGVLRSATSAGELADVCDEFVRLRDASTEAWIAMRRVLLYPLVLLLVLLGLGFLAAYWVIPPMAEIFEEFDLDLPFVTRSLLSVGPYLPWILLVLVAFWMGVMLLPRLLNVGYALRTAMPAVGRVFASISHEQFSTLLSSFIRMRMPLDAALRYTGDLVDDRSLARATYRTADAVERGHPLADVLASHRQFDRSLPVLVRWGEARSNLAESLELAAEMYESRRQQRVHLLNRVLPPVALVVITSSAIIIASSLFSPLANLIGNLW